MGGGLSRELKHDLISLLEVVTDSNLHRYDEARLIKELEKLEPRLKTFKDEIRQ